MANARIASNKKGTPAAKVVRECIIIEEGGRFVAIDQKNRRKVTEGATRERCRFLAGFRHSYAVVAA